MPAEDIHIVEHTLTISLIPKSEFERVNAASQVALTERLALIADMNRANTLAAVKRAGSGHLGSSLSAMDIITWLYYHEMNTVQLGVDHPDRDIYFSSKGHDVPGLYSLMYSVGIVPRDRLLKLRRFGGLDGHPDVGISGIEANSGSLGMGISKGKGMALAKRLQKHGGRVFVLTGDGELQEGQNYEALHSAVQHKVGNLIVIVDNNKVQSDKRVEEIMAIGDLEAKFNAFGWVVERCDGHDYVALERIFAKFNAITDRPKILIADTIKGRGVSFMEHPFALANNNGLYPWHAGAPDDEAFTAAHREIMLRVNDKLAALGLAPLSTEDITPEKKSGSGVSTEYVARGYGEGLVELGWKHKNLVVLDADLSIDCHLRPFEHTHGDRFFEMGIAEQDMVSTACGMAGQGLIPVVNSFASFLASRANEQIYNTMTEKRKVIFACHFAGLIPAGPGKSHQSLRDISLFSAFPNCTIIQPASAAEAKMALTYGVEQSPESVMLRMNIGPSPRIITLPDDYQFTVGRGAVLRDGTDALVFAYGPVMLNEVLGASERLAEQGFSLKVVNMPWLNRFDMEWLSEVIANIPEVYVVEDHATTGGLGEHLLYHLVKHDLVNEKWFEIIGVDDHPACGTPPEALKYHRLDAESLAQRLSES